MKPVLIRFADDQGKVTQTFSVCSLKTGMMDNIFDIAERAEALQKGVLNMSAAREFFRDLKAMIVAVFGGQFTYDELNQGAEQAEIMKVFNDLCQRITGEMQKN